MKRLLILILLSGLIFPAFLSGCTSSQPPVRLDAEKTSTLTAATPPSAPAAVPSVTSFDTDPANMKVIGVIGGVGWSSSAEYYRIMNEKVQNELGGDHSARILMYSIEFGEFSRQERLAEAGDWNSLNATMIDAAERLKAGGADFIIIASNTLNSRADDIERETGLPVLRIYNVTGAKVNKSGIHTVALLGTKYTMEAPFYRNALEQNYGVRVVTPNLTERDYINTVIFDELVRNDVRNTSRAEYVRIIKRLVNEEGAEAVILGCTEIPLLVHQADVQVPVFDTTRIHAEAAVDYALGRM